MVSCLVVSKNIDVKLIFYTTAKIYTAMSSIEMTVVGCCLKFSSYMYVIQSAILFSLYRVLSLLRFKLIENTISKHAEFESNRYIFCTAV